MNPREKLVAEAIKREVERAKETEVMVGIDPESYLGKEILRTGRKVTELEIRVGELTSSIAHLNYQLKQSRIQEASTEAAQTLTCKLP